MRRGFLFSVETFELMHTQNPSATLATDASAKENSARFIPFSSSPCAFIDTLAAPCDLQECASIRIGAATDLLESLTCMSISNTCDQDLRRVVNAAYLLLKDGVELMDAARG